MDNLQRPDEYPFISEVLDVREFFDEGQAFKESILPNVDGTAEEDDANLAERLGCDLTVLKQLEADCDPEELKCGFEEEDNLLSDKIPVEGQRNLITLDIQQRELQKRKHKLSYRQMVCQLHKYKRMNFQVLDTFRDANVSKGISANYIPPDVVLTVSLTKPYNRVLEYHEIRLGRLLTLDSSFYVLGSTPLTALRDKISCISDWSVMRDCSEHPETPGSFLAKEAFKSGFFYINGVFFNDRRDPTSVDLSQPIMEWAQRRSDELGPFATALMEDTQFIDLKIRLGQPYLYVHQGSCEHLIIFTDLRMMSSSDSQNIDDYPLLTSLKPKKRVPCCTCKVYTAKWVAYGHTELPFDPGFFCDSCYRSFNYNKDGNKSDDFQAMAYCDRSVLS